MAAICDIRDQQGTDPKAREESVQISRVPVIGEKIRAFSITDTLCDYEVVEVIHHARGSHQSKDIDATVTVGNIAVARSR